VHRILELIQSLPLSSNAVLKETQIFNKLLIVTFMAIIVYRVSWLFARAILWSKADLWGRNVGATGDRHALFCSAQYQAPARGRSAYLILRALVRFLGFARFFAIVASEVSTPARSKSSS
jgi:hypothetical protein